MPPSLRPMIAGVAAAGRDPGSPSLEGGAVFVMFRVGDESWSADR